VSLRTLLLLTLIAIPGGLAGQKNADPRVERVLQGLRPGVAVQGRLPVRWTLGERMAALHVPGVSIAVIDSGRIAWARGFGVKEAGAADSITVTTLFEAQSISKPVAVTAMLRLVDGGGHLSLDTDVNQYLRSWRVPESRFTTKLPVTLRGIASHSAGLTVGGFPGYMLGDSLPTLVQILNGEPPANNPPIRVDTFPGAIERYSGGGMMVMQQVLIDVTGEPFPTLMRRLVLDPTGMSRSTYEQPLPVPRRLEAASGHDLEGAVIAGKWPVQPEQTAAGLWTTPSDLARWAIRVAAAWRGESSEFLSRRTASQMLTRQKESAGLGVFLEGDGAMLRFGHSGSNRGFRAEFVMFPAAGNGAVIMTNADQGGELISEVFQSVGAEYHWPGWRQIERKAVTLAPSVLDGLVGAYRAPGPAGTPIVIEVMREGEQLFFQVRPFIPKLELFAAGRDSFFTLRGSEVTFARDSLGRASTVNLGGQVEGRR
jgi:CubicO group peptidase (beta-lactamase class C family)